MKSSLRHILLSNLQETLNVQKGGRIGDYQRQIGQLENVFEGACEQSKRKFDNIESSLTRIANFLDVERRNKAQQLNQRTEEIARRQQLLKERFAAVKENRQMIIQRSRDAIWEKEELLKSDIEKEQKARIESLEVIKDCAQRDFP